MHCVGGEVGTAENLHEHVRVARKRLIEALREDYIVAVAAGVADEHRVDLEQLGLGQQEVEHALADRSTTEQCNAEALGSRRPRLGCGQVGDRGRFGRNERCDSISTPFSAAEWIALT